MPEQRLAIAQVSPFALETRTDVGEYVNRLSAELHRRGHRVLVVAPSHSTELVSESREALRAGTETLLERADHAPVVLGVGEVLPFSPTRRRQASLPVDVARTLEQALSTLPLDIVHVHEPFAPSASSAALRAARSLSVASFHNPTERALSVQLGRQLSERLFSRIDARVTSSEASRTLMQRFFPAEYHVVTQAADPIAHTKSPGGLAASGAHAPLHMVLVADEERGALRTFLRALRLMPTEAQWRATIWSSRPLAAPATLSHRLTERVRYTGSDTAAVEQVLAEADVLVLGSDGAHPTPGLLAEALVSGIVPVASS